jgi:hypothetical protein
MDSSKGITSMLATRLGKFIGVLSLAVALQGCVIIPISGLGGRSDYGEMQLRKGSSRKILVLDIEGVINGGGESSGFFASESTVVQVTEKLRKAEKDSNIKAVVIRMDSPGGGVTASDIIYREVLRFKEKTKIPGLRFDARCCGLGRVLHLDGGGSGLRQPDNRDRLDRRHRHVPASCRTRRQDRRRNGSHQERPEQRHGRDVAQDGPRRTRHHAERHRRNVQQVHDDRRGESHRPLDGKGSRTR